MNTTYSLNDPLNLRDLIDTVTEHIRNEGAVDAQPRTLSGFLEIMLFNVSFLNKTPKEWSEFLLKLFSGNIHYSKAEPLAELIASGEIDHQLLANMKTVTGSVALSSNAEDLYSLLLRRVSKRFFSETEIETLIQCHEQRNNALFLLTLVKHGFSSLYNLPCFFAERIYEEALTYDYDAPLRFSLMREAAENGNRYAAFEYGNYLAKSGPYEEAFEYMLRAAPLPTAVWNLAYLIERGWVGEKQVRQCINALKIDDKIAKNKEFTSFRDELDQLESNLEPAKAEACLTSYRIYFYLAYRGFFKAFNSMAILLESGKIGFSGPAGKEKSEQLRVKYSQAAIAGGNVVAVSNEGNRLRRKRERQSLYEKTSSDEQYVEELLTVAANAGFMHACFYLGNYYEYIAAHGAENVTLNKILDIYKRAEELDLDGTGIHGQLFFRLAKMGNNIDEQIVYYEKALKNAGNAGIAAMSEAAYALSLCCCEKYNSDHDKRHLTKASKKLDEMIQYMSEEYRSKAKALQSFISEELQKL